jgi:hypothetical protein
MGHISGTWELLLCEYWRKSMIICEKNTDLKRLTGRLKLRFLTEIGWLHWNQGEEVAHFAWFGVPWRLSIFDLSLFIFYLRLFIFYLRLFIFYLRLFYAISILTIFFLFLLLFLSCEQRFQQIRNTSNIKSYLSLEWSPLYIKTMS